MLIYDAQCISITILILNKRYENAKFECIGGSAGYLKIRCKSGYIIQNHDFIILYGDDEYRNYEFNEMKELAKKISNENNKRVSIGYSYFIPLEKRINGLSEEVKFASYKDNDEYEEILLPSELNDANDLASLIIQNNDILESQKVK